ncbi:MAG: hypothetical protein MJE77_09675 [Proteobacteria bacterium]|nr:hypothetical protein [Pseudomonadota bacterium]
MPFIDGTRLCDAVLADGGGLGGSPLLRFIPDITGAIRALHQASLIHRDVHPHNIYMVIEKATPEDQRQDWVNPDPPRLTLFGKSGLGFRWVLADCTSALLVHEAAKSPPMIHKPFTPEEQIQGAPTLASDAYAFGATLVYGISGFKIPTPAERRLARMPPFHRHFGGHPSWEFPEYLDDLLSMDSSRRYLSEYLEESTSTPSVRGLMYVRDETYLRCDQHAHLTRLCSRAEAETIARELASVPRPLDDKEGRRLSLAMKTWLAVLEKS